MKSNSYKEWESNHDGRLALILLCDQLSRSYYRGKNYTLKKGFRSPGSYNMKLDDCSRIMDLTGEGIAEEGSLDGAAGAKEHGCACALATGAVSLLLPFLGVH